MSENQSEKKQEISKEPVSDIEIENEKQAEQVKQVVVEAIRSEFSGQCHPRVYFRGMKKFCQVPLIEFCQWQKSNLHIDKRWRKND